MIGKGTPQQRTNNRCDTIHRSEKSIVLNELGYWPCEEIIRWTYTVDVGVAEQNKLQ